MAEESRSKTPVDELFADVEAYIEDWFQAKLPYTFPGGVRWAPATDVYETDTDIVVTMAIPGMRVENIGVQFERNTLRVHGTRHESCGDRRHYYTMEIPDGPFERRVRIMRPIKVDAIRVTYREGLFQIALPKAPTERTVPIE